MNRLFTFIAMFILSVQFATAALADWVVERVSSSVWSSPNGADWQDVEVGQSFAETTWIQTGTRGQVIFARGTDRIVYRPETIATLESQGNNTNVGTVRGSVLLSLDPNRGGRTIVDTPHLAAVVLGTVLEVSTDDATSSVRVDQGRVRVDHGGRSAVVEMGQEGVVQANATGTITIDAALVTTVVPNGAGFGLITGQPEALPADIVRNNAAALAGANGRGNGNAGNLDWNGNAGNGNAGNAAGNGNARNAAGNGNAGNAAGNGNAGNSAGNGNAGNAAGNGNAGNSAGNGNGGNGGRND